VYEQPSDLEQLQHLLDRSRSGASDHLRSIIRPERALPAVELVERVAGMRTVVLSTVSAGGRPRTSAVDGHFLKGAWFFTTSGGSVKAQDLRARPGASVAYIEGDELGVFTHGDASFLSPQHPDRAWVEDHLTRHYGQSPSTWGPDIVYIRVQPRWMVAFQAHPAAAG
jgi:general stress protein 26